MSSSKTYRGRLAPTPSGYLHLGHARTFAIAQKRAQERAGTLVMRIEDIDFERCKPRYTRAAIDDLRSAGFRWNEGFDVGGDFAPYVQSERTDFYKSALLKLIDGNFVYPCDTSRAQIFAAKPSLARKSFEDAESEIIFPIKFRPQNFDCDILKNPFLHTWRFRVAQNKKISFQDGAFGKIEFEGQEDFGDFVVWRKIGVPAYELAVCVDDAAMEITEVVRGADLLVSTARQIMVYEALKLSVPDFYHCKILRSQDGKKLSKTWLSKDDTDKFLIRNSPDAARKFLLECSQ